GYIGQSYHVPVSVMADRIAMLTADELLKAFAGIYRRKYGYFYDDVPVELVTVYVSGSAGAEIDALPELPIARADASAASRGRRRAYSARQRCFVPFTIYRRELLQRDNEFAGPCLIEEDAATAVVDAGARVTVDRYGSLDIHLDVAE